MILFPINPTWFALKFITRLRKHEKCCYKPSIRQAIAICNLILARLLNKGTCSVEDFIDIAVVTSPLENQALARQIAKKILSYSESIEKGYGESSISSNLLYDGKAKDLLDDIEDFDTNLEAIMDDFEFLKNYGKDLENFDISDVENSLNNNFFEEFKHELEMEPYKTALDVIQKNVSIDFDKINNLNSLLDLAKKVLSESGSLKNLLDLSLSEFLSINGIGKAKAAQIIAALELGRRTVSEKNGSNVSFRCSEEVANYYIPLLKDLKKEQFRVILLDIKNRVIKEVLISQGSLTSSIVRLATKPFAGRVRAIARLV